VEAGDKPVEEQRVASASKQSQISSFSRTTMVKFTFACYYPAEEPFFIPVESSLDVWVESSRCRIFMRISKRSVKCQLAGPPPLQGNHLLSLANSQLSHSRRIF
jgi:hypothetical protein